MGITGCRVHWYLLLEYSHSNPVTVGRGVGVPSGLLCTLRVLNIQEANHQQILNVLRGPPIPPVTHLLVVTLPYPHYAPYPGVPLLPSKGSKDSGGIHRIGEGDTVWE